MSRNLAPVSLAQTPEEDIEQMTYEEFASDYGFRSQYHTDCSYFQQWMDIAHQTGGIDEVTVVQIESLNLHSDIYPEGLRNAHRHVADRWSSAQRTLVQHQHELEEAFDSDMFGHVAENTYVNGLRLQNAVPNLR